MAKKKNIIYAKDCQCCVCGRQAVALWPVIDPDIPAFPYCRKCLDKVKMRLLIQLNEIDKNCKRKRNLSETPTGSKKGGEE